MTSMEIRALEAAGRSTTVWTDGYDEQRRQGVSLKALLPAILILSIAACLLLVLL